MRSGNYTQYVRMVHAWSHAHGTHIWTVHVYFAKNSNTKGIQLANILPLCANSHRFFGINIA